MSSVLLLSDVNSSHTQKWAIGLKSKGWDVFIFSLHEVKEDWFSEHNISIETFGLPLSSAGGGVMQKLKYFRAAKLLESYERQVNPDIIHAHYATSYGELARLIKKPFILSLWGSDVYNFSHRSPIHKWYFKRIVKAANVVCSTSKDMAEECKKYIDVDINIIPFGIDFKRFNSTKVKARDVLTIGTIKSLEDVYGIDRLIKAYASFKQGFSGESQLLIYGSGSKLEELQLLTKELNVEKEVKFMGFVSGNDLLNAYDSLDIYVALSRRESFGVAVIEAEAMKLPVIVSNAGGLVEVVVDNETGFIIEDGDVDKAAEAINKLTDTTLRLQLGENAYAFVEKNFNFDKNLEDQIKLYNSVLS